MKGLERMVRKGSGKNAGGKKSCSFFEVDMDMQGEDFSGIGECEKDCSVSIWSAYAKHL